MANSPVFRARVRPNCIWETVTLSQYFHIIVEILYVGPVLLLRGEYSMDVTEGDEQTLV